jgi:hypothetical protein
MKQLAATAALILLMSSSPTDAQSLHQKMTIEQQVKVLSDAYVAKTLGSLDAARPYSGKVRIIIEHSLGDDSYEVKGAATLEDAEEWLKNREREDGTPFREARPLLKCRKGVCTYNFDGGISHNHLYLQKISYGYRNGSPYIKTIYLLDGD